MSSTILQRELAVPSSWRARPRSFVSLMTLYESNYLRLRALLGEPASVGAAWRSSVRGDCDLLLTPAGRSAHTIDLRLTYLLEDELSPDLPARVPDVLLRVYEDARLCEILPVSTVLQSTVRQDGSSAGSGRTVSAAAVAWEILRRERELGQRWVRNQMLNKWLEYCLERGHCHGQGATWRLDQSAQAQSETQSDRCGASGPSPV
jgi:uncharacterized protein